MISPTSTIFCCWSVDWFWCSIVGPKVPALPVTALRIRKSKSFATTSTSRCGEGCSDFEWMRLQTFGFGDFLGIFLQMIVWRVARAHLHPLLLKPSDLNWFGLLLTATLACPFCFRGSVGEALERDHAKASRDQARGADPGVWDRIWDYVATDWDSCESFTSSTDTGYWQALRGWRRSTPVDWWLYGFCGRESYSRLLTDGYTSNMSRMNSMAEVAHSSVDSWFHRKSRLPYVW